MLLGDRRYAAPRRLAVCGKVTVKLVIKATVLFCARALFRVRTSPIKSWKSVKKTWKVLKIENPKIVSGA